MAEFFSSGMVAVVVFAFMLIEGVVLALIFERTGKGIAPLALVCSLGAGAGLVLALLATMVGAAWPWIATGLIVSLLAHVGDVCSRWSVNQKSRRG
jgi:hypothetical protein